MVSVLPITRAVDGMRESGLSQIMKGEGIPVALQVNTTSRPATDVRFAGIT